MSMPGQSRANVSPIYKYVKEITESDIDASNDPYNLKETFKSIIKKLNLNDKINLLTNMGNGIFLGEKVGGENFFLPVEFLDNNFIRVSDETSQSARSSMGGKRKTRRNRKNTIKRKRKRHSIKK